MNYVFAILFGLFGAFCGFTVLQELVGVGWPSWLLVVAAGVILCVLFLAARRLLRPGDMSVTSIGFRRVACWASLLAPFAAWTLCYGCEFWPWGVPVTKIYLAWHLGFFGSGLLALLAIVPILARREYRWVWMPIVGLGLTVPLAVSTEHLMHIL
jgi:hypothetical protein